MILKVASSQSGLKFRSLRRYGSSGQPLVRMVCFPWCGAGASAYRKLAKTLPDHIDLLAVQLPGREERFSEPRLVRMEKVIEHIVDDIHSVFDRRLVFFGHSMGALVAYETARALKSRIGREPDLLVLSGHAAPARADADARHWHKASDDDFIANINALGGTPAQLIANDGLMRAFLPLMRADYEVLETYAYDPEPKLSCPLVACAGDRDGEVLADTMDSWKECTTGPSLLHWFNGDHFYLTAEPEVLSCKLLEWIAAAGRERFFT